MATAQVKTASLFFLPGLKTLDFQTYQEQAYD